MSASAFQFQGMIASIIPSQTIEVLLGKQPALADYGRELRVTLNAMPPHVSLKLVNDLRLPVVQLLRDLEEAIIARELAVGGADRTGPLHISGSGAGVRRVDEIRFSASDDWNLGS
jgi:hypothetical protein